MWTDQHDEPLLTVPEVAHVVRQHAQTVRRMMRTGQMPGALKIGGEWRISKADFAAYMDAAKARPGAALDGAA